jgi:hypothetical protein
LRWRTMRCSSSSSTRPTSYGRPNVPHTPPLY